MATKKRDVPDSMGAPAVASRRPLIFISHDSRDADLAEAFEHLLIDASGGVLKAFRSSDRKGLSGIEFGAEWYATVMSRLEEATDVVALLTLNSLGRPWILYEVGVARGRLGVPAFGVAFGVPLEAVSGPFSQFQNSPDDQDSLTKLVLQLIRRNPDATPREEAVRRQVSAFLERLATTPGATSPVPPADTGAPAKLFEEVKALVRALPEQIVGRLQESDSGTKAAPSVGFVWVAPVLDVLYKLERAKGEHRARPWDAFVVLMQGRASRTPDGVDEISTALREGNSKVLAAGVAKYREFLHAEGDLPAESIHDNESFRLLERALEILEDFLPKAE